MEIREITSRQNKLVRRAAALGEDAAARREQGFVPVRGGQGCARTPPCPGVEVEACFFTRRGEEPLWPVPASGAGAGPGGPTGWRTTWPSCSPPPRTARGCSACAAGRKGWGRGFREESSPAPAWCWSSFRDPGNLGTVLRTAEALGVGQVFLLGECCDPLSPQGPAGLYGGGVFRLRLGAEPEAGPLCAALRGQGYGLHAAVVDGDGCPGHPAGPGPGEAGGVYWKRGQRPASGDRGTVRQPGDHPHGGGGRSR